MAGTIAMIVLCILQYGARPRVVLADALAPVGYYGPLVAGASLGVFVCMNSGLAAWRPGARAARTLRELSDSAFGMFLVHFAVIVGLREIPLFAQAHTSLSLSAVEWMIVVVVSFALVIGLRRVPYLNRLV